MSGRIHLPTNELTIAEDLGAGWYEVVLPPLSKDAIIHVMQIRVKEQDVLKVKLL